MSASPAGGPPFSRTPNGTTPLPAGVQQQTQQQRRPKPKVNPLNARHKPSKQIQRPKPAIAPQQNRDQAIPLGLPPKTFTQAPPSPTDLRPADVVYPIKATRKELLAGMRFHVARMISKDHVDLTDDKEWERPIKLHRKDPRYQAHANGAVDVDSKDDVMDEKQREALEAAKAERQRIREEQAKQMAPSAVQKRKPQAFKKKVEQVYRADDTPEERKRQQLRYEEALPWHIEDFEEKKIWSAGYEAALSECHVMLVEQQDKSFRLVPLEKWYRFREKSTQKKERLDPDVAEKQMARGAHAPRWLMKNEEKQKQMKKEEDAWQRANLYTRSGTKEEAVFLPSAANDGGGIDLNTADVDPDANDIDFNVDEEFADDEENELFEGIDEDTKKMAEEKLKRDQLKANVFDMKDEKEVDQEEETEKRLKEVSKALEKGTRKALLKREKNYDYASDSEGENPYSSSSESEDSETERLRDEERKKEEEAKAKADAASSQDPSRLLSTSKDGAKGSNTATKNPSGASSAGRNTPSHRSEKHTTSSTTNNNLRVKAIKRPGSPNLSEASGNESSAKRQKLIKKVPGGMRTPRPDGVARTSTQTTTSGGGGQSRQGSFIGQSTTNAGSGSDTDARSGSATASKPHIKITLSQRNSRAASPAASPPASRGQSPPVLPAGGSNTNAVASSGFPLAPEIIRAVPKEGITIHGLLAVFRGRVPKEENARFIGEVKKVTKMKSGALVLKDGVGK